MKLNPLDIFKIMPLIASAIASDAIGQMLNPSLYTPTQHYTYLIVGGAVGGLWSISLLGGFAKSGNKKSLIRWAIPLALAWSLDAQIVRDKVLDTTINPHYTEMKKEYATSPKSKNLKALKEKLAEYEIKIRIEKDKIKSKNINYRNASIDRANNIYLSNYKTYGWWRQKSNKTGCPYSVGLRDNRAERERRINCIADSIAKKADETNLNSIFSQKEIIKTKIKNIESINFSTKQKEKGLQYKIKKIESETFPMWVYYVAMFLFGWFMESVFPHLKYWQDWDNEKAEEKNETVGSLSRKIDVDRNHKTLLAVDEILATKNSMIEFLELHAIDAKINQKYNTFFAILRAIRAGENDLKIATVQKYSIFINPYTKSKYSTKRHTTQIRKEFAKLQNLEPSELSKIIKKI